MAELNRGEQIQQALDVMRRARDAGQLNPQQAEQLHQLEKLALDSGELPGYPGSNRYQGEPDEPIQEAFNPAMLAAAPVLGPAAILPLLAGESAVRAGGEGQGGATLGEIAGNVAAGAVPGGGLVRNIVRPVLGALGAAGGLTAERKARGLETTKGQMATEAGLSLAPQVIEESVRGIGRRVLRGSNAARRLRGEAAAQELSRASGGIFRPPGRQVVADAYDAVKTSGEQVAIDGIQGFFTQLNPSDIRYLRRRTEHFRAPDVPGADLNTQRQIFDAFAPPKVRKQGGQQLPNPPRTTAMTIGAIDGYRQQVNKMAHATTDPHAKDLLNELRFVLDNAVDDALASKQLDQARAAHFLQRSAEYFDELVHKPSIMSRTEDGRFHRVNLGRLMDAVEFPQNRLGEEVKRRLDMVSGAGDRFGVAVQRLQRHYPYIEMAAPSSEGIRGSFQRQLGQVMLSPLGRRLFEQAVVEGRGRIDRNTMATIANAVRRTATEESSDSPAPSIGALIGLPGQLPEEEATQSRR